MRDDKIAVGLTKRTPFSIWKVEAYTKAPVSFYLFGGGFGCGQTIKIGQGQKQSLQTQFKMSLQSGFKVPGPLELAASTTYEESMTLAYEFSSTLEWSYAARPCEYCWPTVVFPDASVTVWSKRPRILPFFVSRQTRFDHGGRYEILGNCGPDPERCRNCQEAHPTLAGSPSLTAPHSGGAANVERVVFADRRPNDNAEKLLSDLMDNDPEQLYISDHEGKLRNPMTDGPALLSIDDVDRALGAVRLGPGDNRLLILARKQNDPGKMDRRLDVSLRDEEGHRHPDAGVSTVGPIGKTGLELASVDIKWPGAAQELEGKELKLQIETDQGQQHWPIVMLPISAMQSVEQISAGSRKVTTRAEVASPRG
jgi:hypothetical protein